MDQFEPGALGRLRALQAANPDDVWSLVSELARESAAIRASAPTKYVFDGRWREVGRWLLHDGWRIEDRELVRLAPAAEEATGIRDTLIDTLASSDLDSDGSITASISKAAEAFLQEPPDYNASTTQVRIALETIARRSAKARAGAGGAPYPTDSWGSALACLKTEGMLETSKEEILARVYTFISPGAHVPKGVSEEEWARLARTFGLGACFFILKKHNAR